MSTCPEYLTFVPCIPCELRGCLGDCGAPINLENGSVRVSRSYLETNYGDFQMGWYNLFEKNCEPFNPSRGLGTNWTSGNFAFKIDQPEGAIGFLWDPSRNGKVDIFEPLLGEWKPKYCCEDELDETDDTYRVSPPDGSQWEFEKTSGMIKKQISAGGIDTDYTYDSSSDRITDTQRTYTSGGQTTIESRKFDYFSTGSKQLQYVTLRRATDATNPVWTDIRRLELVYYGNSEDHGNLDDIKLIKQQIHNGTSWVDDKVEYFRYYKDSLTDGYKHGLKYVLSPEGYERMSNPETALDSVLADYASEYYEYDSDRRVTKAAVDGGATDYTVTYTVNDDLSNYNYNYWSLKAVMTTNDGATKTVYANHIGQDILIDLKKGTNQWIAYSKYNSDSFVTEQYSPSAINMSGTPYNDANDDLAVQLNTTSGLINLTTYHSPTTLRGFPEYQQVQNGTSNPKINVSKTLYAIHQVAGESQKLKIPSNEIVYISDSGSGDPVETTFSYTFHTDTLQILEATTNLPNVPVAENGVNFPQNNTIKQKYDIQGRLEKDTDARGIVTDYLYYDDTGAMKQMTQDVGVGELNLVTDYEVDSLGRTTQTLGPEHNINGQTVRTATWTVYKSLDNEVWNGQGYKLSSNYTLINPVSIAKMDKDGRPVDQIQATRGSSVEDAGKLTESNTFTQSSYVRWSRDIYDDGGRLTATKIYYDIPSTGEGNSTSNFNQSDYKYDSMGRQNFQETPGETISRTVYDVRNNVVTNWIGTDNTDATDSDPTGGGATGNNMVMVTHNKYDQNNSGDEVDGGDGNLTSLVSPVDDNPNHNRTVDYKYDWRDRQTTTVIYDGTNTFHQINTLDNLDRTTISETKRDDSGTLVLIDKNQTEYDTRGRVWQTLLYSVSDSGTVGTNVLEDNSWYDANNNVLKSQPSGSQTFNQTIYDALNRATNSYTGYWDGTGTEDPEVITNMVVFEETETTYDDAGNVTLGMSKERFDDATGLGELNGPSGSQPKSRDSYAAIWYDEIGRQTEAANYGTNSGTAPTRPTTAPSSSDTILVSQAVYNSSGELEDQIDAADKTIRTEYDDAGRITKVTNNHGGIGTEVTRTEYNVDSLVSKLIDENSTTGNQETVYTYGVTTTNSEIASNNLLQKITYPDTKTVEYEYNSQGDQIKMTDQNETVHDYEFDLLGRPTEDKVTLAGGSAVDGSVKRIQSIYDNRGRLENVRSHSATSGGSVTSDVQYEYNDFNQLKTEYQQDAAAVITSTSPKVQYGYEDASNNSNTIRFKSLTYPDARVLNYDYETGSKNDKLSRVQKLKIGTTEIVDYSYLGLSQIVIQNNDLDPSTDIKFTLAFGTGSDPYDGMDRFGRIVDLRWVQGSTELVHLEYDYDRVGNRLYRRNEVDRTNSKKFDGLYKYDELDRLKEYDRGELNDDNNAIVGTPTLTQDWIFDQLGNWTTFEQGEADALKQTRTHSTTNEISTITKIFGDDLWPAPVHDDNGNMTKMPQPKALGDSYTGVWDAWNRLIKLTNDADSDKAVAGYEYDGLNRRTIKKTYKANGITIDKTRHFYYNNEWQVLQEDVLPDGESLAVDRQFIWGLRYIDDLILRDRSDTGTLDERLYCLQDALYNAVAVTNESGTVKQRYEYTAYGKSEELKADFTTPYSGTEYNWEYRFTGRRIDLETNLYQYRNRYYHAELGRFVSRDPIGYVDGENLYAYVWDNPTIYLDPSGLIGVFFLGAGQRIGGNTTINDLHRAYKGSKFLAPSSLFIDKTFFNARIAHTWVCKKICKNVKFNINFDKNGKYTYTPKVPVDIFGWSRGAIAALKLVDRLNKHGCTCFGKICTGVKNGKKQWKKVKVKISPIPVRFLGLIDPVARGTLFAPKAIATNVKEGFVAEATGGGDFECSFNHIFPLQLIKILNLISTM